MIKTSLISAGQPRGASSSCSRGEQSRPVLHAARLPIHLHAGRHAEPCPVMLNEAVCSLVHALRGSSKDPATQTVAQQHKSVF